MRRILEQFLFAYMEGKPAAELAVWLIIMALLGGALWLEEAMGW